MTWAQRLKRVFNIDIETCPHCQGPVKIISCIDDPAVIQKILTHLSQKATAADQRHSGPNTPAGISALLQRQVIDLSACTVGTNVMALPW